MPVGKILWEQTTASGLALNNYHLGIVVAHPKTLEPWKQGTVVCAKPVFPAEAGGGEG
jgi:hypothetical protein